MLEHNQQHNWLLSAACALLLMLLQSQCVVSLPALDSGSSLAAIFLGAASRSDGAPDSLSYSNPAFIFTVNTAIATSTPTYSGSISSCTASPALPTGLTLDQTSCALQGTPTVLQAATNHTVTASNATGSTTAIISITVNASPPSALNYAGNPYTFTQNTAIPTTTPTYSGSVTSCTASPTLPAGLAINTTTCAITGTPTGFQASTAYTITASNAYGSTNFALSIAINEAAPSALNYAGNPFVFTRSVSVGTNTPTYSGSVTSCTASPALPAGLSINNTTCAITGTPSALQVATSYTITASNSGGSTNTSISITVNDAAPASLNYAGNPYTFTRNTAISTVTPTFSGTLTSCTASPSLPAGLAINNTTCAITGTPTTVQTAQSYTITAANSGGSTNASITITVNDAAPTGLTYSGSPFTFNQGLAISTITPTITGSVTACSSTPSLPAGLAINNTTCAISGTPSATQAASSYTITASNSGGSTNTSISITINLAPPSALSYSGSPYTFTRNASIGTITPTVSGTIQSCSSSPTLPAGLSLNNSTCALMGTPSAVQTAQSYTITASNSGGSTNTSISITINDAPPSSLSYGGTNFALYRNETISTMNATVTGTITSCNVSPALPTGLAINTTTCAISGHPTVLQSSQSYTITASNSGGSTNVSINFSVVPRETWIAVGQDGAFYSIDDGANWSASNGDGTGMRAVASDGAGLWIAVSNSGAIYQTTDGGSNWTSLPSPTANALQAIATDGSGNWVVVGDASTILYSSDNGSNWSTTSCSGLVKTKGVVQYGGVWTAVGDDGGGPPNAAICYSTDNGASWSTAGGSYTADVILSIGVSGDGTRAMTGVVGMPPPPTGYAFTSSDGQNISSGSISGVVRAVAGSSGSVFAGVGESGILRLSSDGSSWSAGTDITGTHLNAIANDGASNWVCGGEAGKIFYSSTASPTSWNATSASGTSNPIFGLAYGIK